MEDTLLEKMAQLLIDISDTNLKVLEELQKSKTEYKLLSDRVEVLEGLTDRFQAHPGSTDIPKA